MSARVTFSAPIELLDLIMQRLPPSDLLRCAAVCRIWRNTSETVCQKKYQQEYGSELLIVPPRSLESWREKYAFNHAVCSARSKGWETKETHPQTLYDTRGFLQPGKTDIVCDKLTAPIEFEEVNAQTYFVRCGVKARLTFFPVRGKTILKEFPESIGPIWQEASGFGYFFVLAGEGAEKKIHRLSKDLSLIDNLPNTAHCTCLTFDSSLLVAGTEQGKLLGWKIIENQPAALAFSHQLGQGCLSWLAVYTRGEQRLVTALQGDVLWVVRNLFSTPHITKIPLAISEGQKPCLHGPYLIWRSSTEEFMSIHLGNNNRLEIHSDWTFAHPIAGRKLLVQDKNNQVFVFDEQMHSFQIGSFSEPLLAADFRSDFLLAAFSSKTLHLYRLSPDQQLREVYQCEMHPLPGEKILTVALSTALTIIVATNHGRLSHGGPLFKGIIEKPPSALPAHSF